MAYSGRLEAYFTIPTGISLQATNLGGTTSVTITAGSYTPSSFLAHLLSQLNALRPSGWTGSLSLGATGTGRIRLECATTWSITWSADNVLRDTLGFAANIVAAVGPRDAVVSIRGLWLPWCPLMLDGESARAPIVSDLRTTRSPTGNVYALSGTKYYRHKNLVWSHVPRGRTFEAVATHAGNTWETWFEQTQIGGYVSWFTPGAAFDVYDHYDVKLGSDSSVSRWRMVGLDSMDPSRSEGQWPGLWSITIPEIVG